MSDNGKGDKRRPMTIDPRQLEINWVNTFYPIDNTTHHISTPNNNNARCSDYGVYTNE